MKIEPIRIETDGRVSQVIIDNGLAGWYMVVVDPPIEWTQWNQLELELNDVFEGDAHVGDSRIVSNDIRRDREEIDRRRI